MSEQLFSDDPIQSTNEDKLGRQAFAKQVSEVCKNVAAESSSSVIALVGSWGSGKTSILSLAEKELLKSKWSVTEFNPWLLSDIESLLFAFFSEVIDQLPEEADKQDQLRKKWAGYAKAISPLGKLGGLVGIDGSAVIKGAASLIEGDQSVTKQRDHLVEELKKLNKPILVVLDDIDRLHPGELMMVFKLVRLVGRMPNLHYLLSYDEDTLLDVVSQTKLAKGDKNRARAYLEKIVQVKLDLPHMSSQQQLKLVNVSLDEVLRRNSIIISQDDNKRLSKAYRECLSFYLNQPRAIKRYFAQIEALYPLVKGEVNFADFTLLTFLRTFEPNIYQLIIEHQEELTGQGFMMSYHDESNEERRKRWEQMIRSQGVKNEEAVLDLLALLFIPIRSALSNVSYGNSEYKDERIQKRVGNKNYFTRYFVFGVPEDDIPDVMLTDALMELATSEKDAADKVTELIESNAELTLGKIKSIQEKHVIHSEALLKVMANCYSSLPPASAMFTTPPQWKAWDIVKVAVDNIKDSERPRVFREIAVSESGLLMLAHTFCVADQKGKPLEENLKGILKQRTVEVMADILGKKDVDITDQDTDFFYVYRVLVGSEELTRCLWEGVDKQSWDPVTILAMLVSEAVSLTTDGDERTIGELGSEQVDNYFGLDRLLENLENRIKDVDLGGDHRRQKPTMENKKAYVLRLLKNRYDNKVQEEKAPKG